MPGKAVEESSAVGNILWAYECSDQPARSATGKRTKKTTKAYETGFEPATPEEIRLAV